MTMRRLTALTGPVPPQKPSPPSGGPDLLFTDLGHLRRLSSKARSPSPARVCPCCGVVTHHVQMRKLARVETGKPHEQGCPAPPPNFRELTVADIARERLQLEDVRVKLQQLRASEYERRAESEDRPWTSPGPILRSNTAKCLT